MARKIPFVTFEQARRFFSRKAPMTRAAFDLLAEEVKRRAFTVAAVTSMDLLHDLKGAVEAAIDDGLTLAQFKDLMQGGDVLADRGWTGKSPWHAETVFRTNIQSAYGAGRYEQQQELADVYPFAEYHAVGDDRTREEHDALDGTVAELNSSFWATHWPPWDYNCRCSAEPIAEDELNGRKVERGLGPAPKNDFTSPALGADYEPDYARFDPDEAEELRRVIGSA